jgi:protein-S-isoprenylcysteine O-methyltransferase Ste14
MRFLTSKTYFQDLWIGFIVLGGLFVGLGVVIFKRTLEVSSENNSFIGKFQILNKGMYKVVRHPIYLSIILMFIGLSFVFDSALSIVMIPFITILFELQAYYEEKLLFMKHCEEEYKAYREKTPKRLMVPSPLNVFLIIVGFFVIYLGMVNFESIFF